MAAFSIALLFACLGNCDPNDTFAQYSSEPMKALDDARSDIASGDHSDALAKLEWFFDNASKIDRSLHGVRNSFALVLWKRLGDKYEPAAEELEQRHSQCRERVFQGDAKTMAVTFGELNAIGRVLGKGNETLDVFVKLDSTTPDVAREVFPLCIHELVRQTRFDLCRKYIDVKKEYELLERSFRARLTVAEKYSGQKRDDYENNAERRFQSQVCWLVALLTRSDRPKDADAVVKKGVVQFGNNREFLSQVINARRGRFPQEPRKTQ